MVTLPEPLLGPEGYNAEWDELQSFGEGHYLHYDRNGEPMTLRHWVTGYENSSYRILAHDTVGDVCVVTIWNGLAKFDFGPAGPNMIFSSVMCKDHESDNATYFNEIEMSTEGQARLRHAQRVAELEKMTPEELIQTMVDDMDLED